MSFITRFIQNTSMVYQFVLYLALCLIGGGLALPGGKKWGWVVFALGILGVIMMLKIRVVSNL